MVFEKYIEVHSKKLETKVLAMGVLLVNIACCSPIDRDANSHSKIDPNPKVGSIAIDKIPPSEPEPSFKKEVLQYSLDLDNCEKKYSNRQGLSEGHDLAAIRRSLAEASTGDTLIVRHEPRDASSIKVANVKNCLAAMGYVVSR